MRTLVQPGPVHPSRIESFGGGVSAMIFTARAGQSLNEAVTGPLAAAGWRSGTVTITGGAMNPFRYVMPGPADDASHAAYFTAPRAPAGTTRLELANATFGFAGAAPFLHCHAVWTEPDGARRGGHILPAETILASDIEVHAWGFTAITIETADDPETNFTLFQPHGEPGPGAADVVARKRPGVVARVRPNEDITLAVETIARTHGLRDAAVRGSLGSLIGARFTDGTVVTDHATEVLVREGWVRGGVAMLDLVVVDMQGRVREGRLVRGQNAVLITFDVVLDATG